MCRTLDMSSGRMFYALLKPLAERARRGKSEPSPARSATGRHAQSRRPSGGRRCTLFFWKRRGRTASGHRLATALASCALLSAAATSTPALAAEEETPPQGIQYSALAGATFTQTNYVDWAEGGEDALAYVLSFKGSASEERSKDKWGIDGSLGFGQTKVGGGGLRVSINEIVINGLYGYKLPDKFTAYAAAGFRSAIVTGYDYSVKPKIDKASFNDPGYYSSSFGAAYDITPKPIYFRTRLGMGLKYTTARTHFQFGYADDPDTPGKDKSKWETGVDSVTELDAEFTEDLLYASKLELFSRFQDLDIWDVRWKNTVTAKINKYVSAQFELELLYDKDVSGSLQRFQMLSLGVSYVFL
jgi:hypothetical protein